MTGWGFQFASLISCFWFLEVGGLQCTVPLGPFLKSPAVPVRRPVCLPGCLSLPFLPTSPHFQVSFPAQRNPKGGSYYGSRVEVGVRYLDQSGCPYIPKRRFSDKEPNHARETIQEVEANQPARLTWPARPP